MKTFLKWVVILSLGIFGLILTSLEDCTAALNFSGILLCAFSLWHINLSFSPKNQQGGAKNSQGATLND